MRVDSLVTERSVLLVDVDGVCADFVSPVLLEATDGRLKADDITSFQIENFLTEDERKRFEKICSDGYFWSKLPVYTEAVESLTSLVSKGVNVVYVTSPWQNCSTWAYQRQRWLVANKLPQAKNLIVTNLKYLVEGDWLIDDKPTTITEWNQIMATGAPAFLMARPWNAHTGYKHRYSWPEISKIIEADLGCNL